MLRIIYCSYTVTRYSFHLQKLRSIQTVTFSFASWVVEKWGSWAVVRLIMNPGHAASLSSFNPPDRSLVLHIRKHIADKISSDIHHFCPV